MSAIIYDFTQFYRDLINLVIAFQLESNYPFLEHWVGCCTINKKVWWSKMQNAYFWCAYQFLWKSGSVSLLTL